MREKELIKKIKKLRQIKPRQDWVVLAKREILERSPEIERTPPQRRTRFIEVLEVFSSLFAPKRLAYATLTLLFILIGTFGFAQNTVPGDLLFPLRKVTEKGQSLFVSEKGQLKYDFELVNKRLEDLTKIVQKYETERIEPATEELQATITEAAEKLTQKTEQNPKAIREVAFEIKEFEDKKSILATRGALTDEETEDLDNALKQVIEREIEKLEDSTLTEEQEEILEQAKQDFENKDYSQALRVLDISNK